MRKITKSLLTLALLMLAVGGAKATKLYGNLSADVSLEHVTWTASTKTLTWNLSYSNAITISGFVGDLSSYQTITINASGYSAGNEYRLIFYGPNFPLDGGEHKKTLGPFYSNGGTYNLEERGFTSEMLSNVERVTLAGASGSGSIVIEKIYFEKPTTVNFDDSGKAYFDWTDISVSGSTLSYDDQTGTVTSTGTSGTIHITFDKAYDLSALTHWTAAMTGTDIVQHWQLVGAKNSGSVLDMYSGEFDRAFPGSLADPDFTTVTGIKMFVNAVGTMTFTSCQMYLTSNVITSRRGEESLMTDLTAYHWDGSAWQTSGYTPSYRVNESTGAAYFGVDWDGEQCKNYSDVEGYKAIRIYSAQGNVPRAMFFKSDASGQQQFDFSWNTKGGYYELLLSTVYASVSNYKLISVRPASGTTSSISGIYMVTNNPIYDYLISGKGVMTASATAALADATATSYDATGVTETGVDFTGVANKNALFKANDGILANTNNVIVDGVCANLVLTDGYPFKAPADFTATAASYTTTINTTAKAGTLCLPFAATIPVGVEAWTLAYTSGDAATATPVETIIPANRPVLLNGSGEKTFTGSDAAVSASATNTYGALTGVFAATTVPSGSYVLQKQDAKVGFFKVMSDITINPFRAYLTAETPAPGLSIIFPEDNDVTGISEIEKMRNAENVTIFDLQGRKVAQPQKGLYIVNGKKVIFK